MRKVFEFIGVDPSFPINTQQRFNVSGRPLGIQLHHLLQSGSPLAQLILPKRMRADLKKTVLKLNLSKDYMPPDIRRELLNDYAPDVAQLSNLIGRDLSAWLGSAETQC